jgi:hypothetical protein
MKMNRCIQFTAALAAVTLTVTTTARAQTPFTEAQSHSDFSRPFTLAPADTTVSGGGGAGGAGGDAESEAAKTAELVKKSLNPVAAMISLPIQNNWDFGIGSADAMRYTANIQPVIPIALSEDWNVITRTILPVIYAEGTTPGAGSTSGLGDITQSFFFSPKKLVDGWVLGGGPALLYPSATDSALGSGKWGAGPTIVALKQEHGFTYGILANHIWSYAGWGDQNVNATFLQPFFGYSTKTYTTLMVNTESTYNWQAKQWTVPVNIMLNQMLKIGKQPLSLQLGYRYYAEGPSGGPEWGIRFAVTFLFPK